jgi:hypothetical protein
MKICFSKMTIAVVATVVVATTIGACRIASASLASSFTGSTTTGGVYDSAEADFVSTAGGLQITLINTSSAATPDITNLLTGLTFTSTGTETGGGAVVGPGSFFVTGSGTNMVKAAAGGTDVSSQWGYGTGSGNTKIVESSGVFNNVKSFQNTTLDGGAYGLLSLATSALSPGLSNSNHQPLIMNSVVITLPGLDASNISNVVFYYGTGNGEPTAPGTPVPPGTPPGAVPEPASLAVWGLISAATAGAVAMRKQKRARSNGRWSEENRAAIYQVIGGGSRL